MDGLKDVKRGNRITNLEGGKDCRDILEPTNLILNQASECRTYQQRKFSGQKGNNSKQSRVCQIGNDVVYGSINV